MGALEAAADRLEALGATRAYRVEPAPPMELGFITMHVPRTTSSASTDAQARGLARGTLSAYWSGGDYRVAWPAVSRSTDRRDQPAEVRDGRSQLNYSIYHDRYRRTVDGWKFAERVFEVRYFDAARFRLGGAAQRRRRSQIGGSRILRSRRRMIQREDALFRGFVEPDGGPRMNSRWNRPSRCSQVQVSAHRGDDRAAGQALRPTAVTSTSRSAASSPLGGTQIGSSVQPETSAAAMVSGDTQTSSAAEPDDPVSHIEQLADGAVPWSADGVEGTERFRDRPRTTSTPARSRASMN